MLLHKHWTKDCEHYSTFNFHGEEYPVYSIVRLTEEGQKYLESNTREVRLTEHFTHNIYHREMWKYEFKTRLYNSYITNMSTDLPPHELIEEVVLPATPEFALRERLGIDAPTYKTGKKQTKKDWEIPQVRMGWLIYIVIFFGVCIFNDWYIKGIIRIVCGWWFGLYRQAWVEANTIYTHDEDMSHLRKKYEVLYGLKTNEENK